MKTVKKGRKKGSGLNSLDQPLSSFLKKSTTSSLHRKKLSGAKLEALRIKKKRERDEYLRILEEIEKDSW